MKAWARRNVTTSVILIMLAFLVFLIIVTAAVNRASCSWYGYQTERDTRYAAFVGCMVRMPNGWVPRAEIRTAQ
ncbi:hypothetical protein GEV41_13630 [Pseudomonas putida]|uniref:hypothetical protein n=1 Tax=Pseudomonas putida group TaxID=136845 RepID=UPI0015704663|nr:MULTISPECIES: hypothetical protein [Pseudomonas putida group]MCE0989348.1 hypothetical protein [Pseudomonas alloputida]QKL07419.1 hypothetical protein GEV41_13630 [Pseudomonas putida]